MSDIVKLTRTELQRVRVIPDCLTKRLKNYQAAELLKVSVRQLKRLKRRYKNEGAQGLASRKREHPSHNQLSHQLKADARVWLRTHYADFGPTLAHEKLIEDHQWNIPNVPSRDCLYRAKVCAN